MPDLNRMPTARDALSVYGPAAAILLAGALAVLATWLEWSGR